MKLEKIVIASKNKGKIKEIEEILNEIECIPMTELGFNEEIEENGKSLEENALIKAKTIAKKFNMPALADDSGIFVDALGGAPGIYAGRFSGGNDLSNYSLLLEKMKGQTNRHALCKCVICLYFPNDKYYFGIGEMHCDILQKPQGNLGFGYDPVLYSHDLKKCYAEATSEEKNIISHRKRALINLKEKLHSIKNN